MGTDKEIIMETSSENNYLTSSVSKVTAASRDWSCWNLVSSSYLTWLSALTSHTWNTQTKYNTTRNHQVQTNGILFGERKAFYLIEGAEDWNLKNLWCFQWWKVTERTLKGPFTVLGCHRTLSQCQKPYGWYCTFNRLELIVALYNYSTTENRGALFHLFPLILSEVPDRQCLSTFQN